MNISLETINSLLTVATTLAQSVSKSGSVKTGIHVAANNFAVAETIESKINGIVADFKIHRDRGIARHDLLKVKRRLNNEESLAFFYLHEYLANAAKACRVML